MADTVGMSRSAVSREFIRHSGEELKKLAERDPSQLEVLILTFLRVRTHADPAGEPLAQRSDGTVLGGSCVARYREEFPQNPGVPRSLDAQSEAAGQRAG